MAQLNVWHWEKYVPTLGDNAKLEKPFYLMIKSGVTKLEYSNVMREIQTVKTPADLSSLLSQCFSMGNEPLVVNDKSVETFEQYIEVCNEQMNGQLLQELIKKFVESNSVVGERATFSGRPSGGATSTRHDVPVMVATSDGNRTSP